MNQYKIFIDLDGVLADWEGSAIKLSGLEKSVVKDKLKKGIDFEELDQDIWEKINANPGRFWGNLEKYEWADTLVNKMQEYGTVAFLSSGGNPYKNKESVADAHHGKTKWVYNNFEDIPLILTKNKYLCADPSSLLIDDFLNKIEPFIAHGGMGYHWPHAEKIKDGDISLNQIFNEIVEKMPEVHNPSKK